MNLFKQINICNLYIALWVVYVLHWSNAYIPLIESVSNIVLGINLTISAYYTVIAISSYKLPKLFRSINLLLAVFIVYGLIYILFGDTKYLQHVPVKKGTYIVSVLRSFLPVYTFYIFTIKGYLKPSVMRFWTFVFLGVFILIFIRSQFLHSLISSRAEFVNNNGYLFALIIPCVYYWKKNTLIQFILIAVCFVFVLLALKRGAMLTAACAILMFLNYKFRSSRGNHKFMMIFTIIVVSILALSYISDRISESDLFRHRIEQTMEGNTSNRENLANTFMNHYWNHSEPYEQFLGSGADATLDISTNWAHNDWIEVLICQGILGIAVYAYFWISFYKQWRSTREPESRMIIGSYFVIYLIRTIVSMSYSMILTIASMGIGYALATDQKFCRQSITKES